jgi:hypothetical protein
MSKRSPISDFFTVDLSAADRLPVAGLIGYFHVWDIIDTATGQPVLDGTITAQFGDANGRRVPCTYNSKIEFTTPVELMVLSWAAQPNRSARIIIAEDAQAFEANNAPTRQLVTSAIGSGISNGNATVTTTSGVLVPANTLRQSVTIQNRGAVEIFIGAAGVTTANGLGIAPGGSYVCDRTTAAIHAVAASGSADVRVLTELS